MGFGVTRATVLAYHAIGSCPRAEDKHNLFVDEEAFARQMSFLGRRRRVVPLADIVDGRVRGRKPVVAITFDDGYRNVLRTAGPILARHGFPATVFVPTDWRGRVNGWIDPTPCDLEIMDDGELRGSESAGLSIESHGHAHIDMSESTPEEVERDIKASLDNLEILLGRRPRFLAYPYGRIAGWTPAVAERIGLSAAFTIDERHGGLYAYERVQVTPLDTPQTFALKTTGVYLKVRKSRVVAAAYGAAKPLVRRALQRRRA
jgi:peptidoglycan/xylan/chitin deacetylase (PgdA/CDA1 family)